MLRNIVLAMLFAPVILAMDNLEATEHYNLISKIEDHLTKYPDLLVSSKNKDIVVFLGNTGSGKSTLINFLSNKLLFTDHFGRVCLQDPSALNTMAIGSGRNCQTRLPGFIQAGEFIFYDLPGFGDKEDTITNLIKACFIKIIIENAKSVKLVFVSGIDQITSNRGDIFDIFQEKINKLLPNQNIADFSCLIITKSDQDIENLGEYLLEMTEPTPLLKFWIENNKICQMSKAQKNQGINQNERAPILELINNINSREIKNINIGVIYSDEDKKNINKIYEKEIILIINKLIINFFAEYDLWLDPEANFEEILKNLDIELSVINIELLEKIRESLQNNFYQRGQSDFIESYLLNFIRPISNPAYEQSRDVLSMLLQNKLLLLEHKIELAISKTKTELWTEEYVSQQEIVERLRFRLDKTEQITKQDLLISKMSQLLKKHMLQNREIDEEILSAMPPHERTGWILEALGHWEHEQEAFRIKTLKSLNYLISSQKVQALSGGLSFIVTVPMGIFHGVAYLKNEKKYKVSKAMYEEIMSCADKFGLTELLNISFDELQESDDKRCWLNSDTIYQHFREQSEGSFSDSDS